MTDDPGIARYYGCPKSVPRAYERHGRTGPEDMQDDT